MSRPRPPSTFGAAELIDNPLALDRPGDRGRRRRRVLASAGSSLRCSPSPCATGGPTETSGSNFAGSVRRWPGRAGRRRRRAVVGGRGRGAEVLPGWAARPACRHRRRRSQYRLYELDLVVNRARIRHCCPSASWSAMSPSSDRWARMLSSRGDLLVSLVVTGIVAVCFQPLREQHAEVRQPADVRRAGRPIRCHRRARPDAGQVATHRTPCSLPSSRRSAGRWPCNTSPSRHRSDERPEARAAADYGTPGSDVLVFPLVNQGTAVGELRLSPRVGERLRERDHRLIVDLAPQVAAALHAVGSRRSCYRRGSASSSCAKRSAGVFAATCTTGSGPPSPG